MFNQLNSGRIMIIMTLMMGIIISYILLAGEEPNRWYASAQIKTGEMLFENHCAACHGLQAQGLVADWKRQGADGFLPAPPLNGSAHAWHHGMPQLLEIVQQGGSLYDGRMPGFADTLDKEEQLAVIAYFQHYWHDDIYRLWQNNRNNATMSSILSDDPRE